MNGAWAQWVCPGLSLVLSPPVSNIREEKEREREREGEGDGGRGEGKGKREGEGEGGGVGSVGVAWSVTGPVTPSI